MLEKGPFPPRPVGFNNPTPSSEAIKLYETDSVLTPEDRAYLGDKLQKIVNTTLIAGWVGFSLGFAAPLLYKYKTTGSTKSVSFLMVSIPGFVGMGIGSNYATKYSMSKQTEIASTDGKDNCVKMLNLIHPAEASRYWMYYKMSATDPSKIFHDPRLPKDTVNGQPEKTSILQNRDIMGLYSGPGKEPVTDPFELEERDRMMKEANPVYNPNSSWAQIRKEKGVKGDSTWEKIRTNPQVNTPKANPGESSISSNRWGESTDSGSAEKIDQESFDELLERERNADDDKW